MKRVRYLPPGSMRRQRRLGRLEGSVGTLLLVCAIGFGLVSATPAELYQPAPAPSPHRCHRCSTTRATRPSPARSR